MHFVGLHEPVTTVSNAKSITMSPLVLIGAHADTGT